MNSYPRLTEMGVLHPEHIDKFSVNSIAYTDILRIVYERPKGSILPLSRTYKFPRVQSSATIGGHTTPTQTVMESAPAFVEALEELRKITQAKEHNQGVAAAILEEIGLLEEDLALRGDYIKALVSKIKTA